jgi:hypothetical protein
MIAWRRGGWRTRGRLLRRRRRRRNTDLPPRPNLRQRLLPRGRRRRRCRRLVTGRLITGGRSGTRRRRKDRRRRRIVAGRSGRRVDRRFIHRRRRRSRQVHAQRRHHHSRVAMRAEHLLPPHVGHHLEHARAGRARKLVRILGRRGQVRNLDDAMAGRTGNLLTRHRFVDHELPRTQGAGKLHFGHWRVLGRVSGLRPESTENHTSFVGRKGRKSPKPSGFREPAKLLTMSIVVAAGWSIQPQRQGDSRLIERPLCLYFAAPGRIIHVRFV